MSKTKKTPQIFASNKIAKNINTFSRIIRDMRKDLKSVATEQDAKELGLERAFAWKMVCQDYRLRKTHTKHFNRMSKLVSDKSQYNLLRLVITESLSDSKLDKSFDLKMAENGQFSYFSMQQRLLKLASLDLPTLIGLAEAKVRAIKTESEAKKVTHKKVAKKSTKKAKAIA